MPQLISQDRLAAEASVASTSRSQKLTQLADKSGLKHTIYLTSGETYAGSWQGNKREGKGQVVYNKGDKYEGDWQNGKRHGLGILWVKDNGRYRMRYNGEWRFGKPSGEGSMYEEDGSVYEGQWANGLRHGNGQQVYASAAQGHQSGSDVYDGEWELGVRCGRGTLHCASGDIYEGEWQHDMKHGPGSYFYVSRGKRYDGVWQFDVPKCGTYSDISTAEGVTSSTQSILPVLELKQPLEVMRAAAEELVDLDAIY